MIESSWIQPGGAGTIADDGFTIKTIQGCRVVFGQLPIDSLPLVTGGFGEKAEVAFDIADLIGASLVVGEPDALASLRKTDLAVSEKRQADYVRAS